MDKSQDIKKLIGENLAHFREEKGLSLSELGESLGYDRHWVYKRESGKASIDFEDIPQLINVLGIDDPRMLWERGNNGCDRGSKFDFDGYRK